MLIAAMTVAACWAMLLAFSLPKDIWWVALSAGGLLVALAIYMAASERFDVDISSVIVTILLGFALVVVALIKLLDDNPYDIQSGKVLRQSYSEATVSMSCVNNVCTTTPIPEDWALLLQNCEDYHPCRTGWVHFSANVFASYPVGSHYP